MTGFRNVLFQATAIYFETFINTREARYGIIPLYVKGNLIHARSVNYILSYLFGINPL